jgi:hypothetical protein
MIKILDNILPKDTNLRILNELCQIKWFIASDSNNDRFKKIFSEKNSGFSFNSFLNGETFNNETILNFYGFLIFDIIVDRLKINAEIYRIYWNMYLKKAETDPHRDIPDQNFKSILYNLHTTDGGIKIENDFYSDKMGQAKIFNSNLIHQGFGPTNDNVRFNLNIMFKEIKNELIPLLTYDFLNYFKKYNLKNKICVEIGSGDSTVYWSNYFKKIISYENNLNYFNDVKEKTKNILNVEVLKYEKNIFNDINFKKNIYEADIIIIDNNPNYLNRKDFCVFAKENKKKESMIVLDNGTWNTDAYQYMLDNFFCQDFPGKNKSNQATVTSIFFEEKQKNI